MKDPVQAAQGHQRVDAGSGKGAQTIRDRMNITAKHSTGAVRQGVDAFDLK